MMKRMIKYILIHGDFTDKNAQESMEIFNGSAGNSGLITSSLPWSVEKLNVFSYSWTLMGDLFVVTGGIEIDSDVGSHSIQYLNISKIFTKPPDNRSFIWDYPCITEYNALGQWVDMDYYLIQKRSIRFEVDSHSYKMNIIGNANDADLPSQFQLTSRDDREDLYMELLGTTINAFNIYYLLIVAFIPLKDLSKSTNIDMTENSVVWMRWDDQYWYVVFMY